MRHHQGFTLLEVFISSFLASLVMLGIIASQIKILQDARGLYYFQQARGLAEGMAEYVLAHHGNSIGYYRQWQEFIREQLPASHGNVIERKSGMLVTIYWGGSQVCDHNQQGLSGCIIIKT